MFASAGFLFGAKESQVPWGAVIGLIIGGLIVAVRRPVRRPGPVHSLGTLVGGMVIISNPRGDVQTLPGCPGRPAVCCVPRSPSAPSRWPGACTRWTSNQVRRRRQSVGSGRRQQGCSGLTCSLPNLLRVSQRDQRASMAVVATFDAQALVSAVARPRGEVD